MVTRRGGLPPDHTKSPARGDVGAGAVTEHASGDASGMTKNVAIVGK